MNRFLKKWPLGVFTPRLMKTFIDDGGEAAGGGAAGGGAADGSAAAGAGDNAGAAGDDTRSTAERALEFFEKGDEGQGGAQAGQEGADGAVAAAEGQEAGQDGKDGQQAGQLTDEQLRADPRFQELDTFKNELQPVMDQHGIPDAKELGLQLADSKVLYDIMGGKAAPSQLLDVMIQNAGWSRDQVQKVGQDLVGWLTKNGFLKDGAAVAGAKPGDAGFKDPLEDRLNKIEQDRQSDQQRQQQQAEQQHQAKIFDSYSKEITRLVDGANLPKEDAEFFGREVRALLPAAGTNEFKAIVSRIEKGNFVDVQKAFAQIKNREVERLKRYTSRQTNSAQRRQNSAPRTPAGGAPPAPAGSAKRDLKSHEGRTAAALQEWDKN
jgi:hypothetical protein